MLGSRFVYTVGGVADVDTGGLGRYRRAEGSSEAAAQRLQLVVWEKKALDESAR